MTLITFALCLLLGGILTLIAGYIIVRYESRKRIFWESVSTIRSLIDTSELSKGAYLNILIAFHEFNGMKYRNKKVYRNLIGTFLTKYDKFLSYSEPKVKIVPDETARDEDQYNYKILVSEQNIYQNSCN